MIIRQLYFHYNDDIVQKWFFHFFGELANIRLKNNSLVLDIGEQDRYCLEEQAVISKLTPNTKNTKEQIAYSCVLLWNLLLERGCDVGDIVGKAIATLLNVDQYSMFYYDENVNKYYSIWEGLDIKEFPSFIQAKHSISSCLLIIEPCYELQQILFNCLCSEINNANK